MRQLGLALSGGGLRATLYHLGVVRFLRDAGLLKRVTHVTSVSGGSILAAHLVMNWDRYCGSAEDFDSASEEILDLVRLDIRNRIMRRFPFGTVYNFGRRMLGRVVDRRATRTGLLEACYEQALYGDTCLFDLPQSPELHILATNLNEGCLCSFSRTGLTRLIYDAQGEMKLEHQRVGLATIPMAVAASSAFPGFFPPLELRAKEVGAVEGEFQMQRFTDGGVYDNLGIRMFLALDRTARQTIGNLTSESFIDAEAAVEALNVGATADVTKPIRRLAEIYSYQVRGTAHDPLNGPLVESTESLVHGLEKVLSTVDLLEDPVLGPLANGALDGPGGKRGVLGSNRMLVDAALRSERSDAALRVGAGVVDLVIASDAGKKSLAQRNSASTGLIGTAMRASEILMDRVWQLETVSFAERKGVCFVPVTDVVSSDEDANAMHPEVQRQTTRIRTDLDNFSELECSALIRHGYCVARKRLRPHLESEGIKIPEGAPWSPVNERGTAGRGASRASGGSTASVPLANARSLQEGAQSGIWSRFFDLRDWVTYAYLPILLLVFLGLPYYLTTLYKEAQRAEVLTAAISEANPDFSQILALLRDGRPTDWSPSEYKALDVLQPMSDESHFEVVAETRIVDLRRIEGDAPGTAYVRRRFVVRKKAQHFDDSVMRLRFTSRSSELRCSAVDRDPKLRRLETPDQYPDGRDRWNWEIDIELAEARVGEAVTIELEGFEMRAMHQSGKEWIDFPIYEGSDFASMWILLPQGERTSGFDLVDYTMDDPNGARITEPSSQVVLYGGSVLHWTMMDPDEVVYECRFNRK